MTSVKVREPATTSASRERAMDGVSAERSSAPCTVAEGELRMARGLCHSKEERAPFPEFSPRRTPVPAPRKYPPEPATLECLSVPAPRKSPPESASVEHTPVWAHVPEFSPGSLEAHKYSPSHLLLPPPPLSSCSHSTRPQSTIYAVRALRDCHPPTSPWSEFPSTPPPASEARTTPGPPLTRWLHHGSKLPPLRRGPAVHQLRWLPHPTGSALVCRRPSCNLGLHVPWPCQAPSSPPASPLSSVTLAPPRPPVSTPPRRSPAPCAPPRTSGSSPLPLLFGSQSQPQAAPPSALPLLVGHSSSLAPSSFFRLPRLCLPAPSWCYYYSTGRAFWEGGWM